MNNIMKYRIKDDQYVVEGNIYFRKEVQESMNIINYYIDEDKSDFVAIKNGKEIDDNSHIEAIICAYVNNNKNEDFGYEIEYMDPEIEAIKEYINASSIEGMATMYRFINGDTLQLEFVSKNVSGYISYDSSEGCVIVRNENGEVITDIYDFYAGVLCSIIEDPNEEIRYLNDKFDIKDFIKTYELDAKCSFKD